MLRKPNISIGPPIKRFVDGVVYWREERTFRTWIKQVIAVHKHNRIQRRIERKRKGMKRREYVQWKARMEREELRNTP